MFESLIADFLDTCLEIDDDIALHIESHLKCLTGQPAEAALLLSDIPV